MAHHTLPTEAAAHGQTFQPATSMTEIEHQGTVAMDTSPAPSERVPASQTPAYEAAEAAFAEYFVRNYPGPDTIIFYPKWHAPKLFAAAASALRSTVGKQS